MNRVQPFPCLFSARTIVLDQTNWVQPADGASPTAGDRRAHSGEQNPGLEGLHHRRGEQFPEVGRQHGQFLVADGQNVAL